MKTTKLTINGHPHQIETQDEVPLLWILRDQLGMTGTKYGCGVGLCGACTVLDGDEAVRSCQIDAATASGKKITTIEGLSENGDHPIQRAWINQDVAQCGYCQPGMILELRSLLRRNSDPTEDEIDEALADHVCRCGSYPRIRRAALEAARNGGGK